MHSSKKSGQFLPVPVPICGAWNVTGWNAKRVCNFEMILIYNHDPHLPKVREYLIMMILIYNDHALKHVQVYKHDSCNILLQHHSSCPHFCFHATWQSGNAKQKYIERNVFHTITIWSTMSIFRSDMWDTISIYFNAFTDWSDCGNQPIYIYLDLEMHRASNVSPWQESIPGSTWALPKRY